MIKIMKDMMQALEEAAERAALNAYSPYSGLCVGAALLTDDGDIYVGCTVENAASGLNHCAERSALFSAVADGRGRGDFSALFIRVPGDFPVAPCGACRQVLHEFLSPDTVIFSACDSGETIVWTMEELLPDAWILPNQTQ